MGFGENRGTAKKAARLSGEHHSGAERARWQGWFAVWLCAAGLSGCLGKVPGLGSFADAGTGGKTSSESGAPSPKIDSGIGGKPNRDAGSANPPPTDSGATATVDAAKNDAAPAPDAGCIAGRGCKSGPCVLGETTCQSGTEVCSPTENASNGEPCTEADGGTSAVCDNGSCHGCESGKDCTPANSCQKMQIVCSSGRPVCAAAGNALDGAPCGSNLYCNGGKCEACTVGADCVPAAKPCNQGTVSCAAGKATCTDTLKPAANGASCGTGGEVCYAGKCNTCAASVVCIPPGNPCHTGLTSCTTGVSVCIDKGPGQNGVVCAGTNACFRSYTCQAGACTGSLPVTCTASDQCHSVGACDTTTGTCSNPVAGSGTSCNDGNACTTGDLCSAGKCVGGAAPNCNDANPCTDDSCSTSTGCVHSNNAASCSDGNACTTGDVCSAGKCVGGAAPNCNDGNPCTDDSCSTSTGCSHSNNTASCGSNMTCSAGSCACASGYKACASGCVNELNDDANCGACGHSCQTGHCDGTGKCGSWAISTITGANPGTFGVATDGTNIVWADTSSVHEVPTAGGAQITVINYFGTTGSLPAVAMANGTIASSAVDSSFAGVDLWVGTEGSPGDGTHISTLSSGHSVFHFGVALNPSGSSAFIDYTDLNTSAATIQKCSTGGSQTCAFLANTAPSEGDVILASQSYVFWTESSQNNVAEYTFSSGNTTNATTSGIGPYLLAVDPAESYVYWVNRATSGSFSIGRTPAGTPNPTSPGSVVPNTTGSVSSIATDGKYVYYTGGAVATTEITYVPVGGGAGLPLVTGSNNVLWVAFVGGTLYYLEGSTFRAIAAPP